jgi:hypothetical protein
MMVTATAFHVSTTNLPKELQMPENQENSRTSMYPYEVCLRKHSGIMELRLRLTKEEALVLLDILTRTDPRKLEDWIKKNSTGAGLIALASLE